MKLWVGTRWDSGMGACAAWKIEKWKDGGGLTPPGEEETWIIFSCAEKEAWSEVV